MTRSELRAMASAKAAKSANLGGYVPKHFAAVETDGDGPGRLQWCYGDDAVKVAEEARQLACHNRQYGRAGTVCTVTTGL